VFCVRGQSLTFCWSETMRFLIETFINIGKVFLDRCFNDPPPPADASASSETALRILYPTDNGVVLDLSHDESANQSFEAMLEIREQLDKFKKLDAEPKHQLQQIMGDASIARFNNGQTSWKRSSDTTAFDSKRFKTEHPELHQSYLITRPGSRRFLVQLN